MSAPNTTYLEMNFVAETATGYGNNKRVVMENLGNETFRITEGQIGVKIGIHKPKSFIRPMMEWEDIYEDKLSRGYMVTRTAKAQKFKIKSSNEADSIKDPGLHNIVSRLLAAAKNALEIAFSVTVEDISDEMMTKGKEILDDLALNHETLSVQGFNNKLKTLYTVIPRRINNLSKLLAIRPADFPDIIVRERELYDIMCSQIKEARQQKEVIDASTEDFFESRHLRWREATDDEIDYIKTLMAGQGKLVNAWRIVNEETEDNFNRYCQAEKLSEGSGISHLFHGSRTCNFWSIITTGLTINPIGVSICGKAFGNGTYFAPSIAKSLNYTDSTGAIYNGSGAATGFAGIYKVATGKTWDNPSCTGAGFGYKDLQRVCPGACSTWYHGGNVSTIRYDEVIVYQDCQSTIEYLIEVSK